MGLKDNIGFALVLSVFSLVIAALFPSEYTLILSAIVTTLAILSVAFLILRDNSET